MMVIITCASYMGKSWQKINEKKKSFLEDDEEEEKVEEYTKCSKGRMTV